MRSRTRIVDGTARRGLRIEMSGIVPGYRRRELGTRVKFESGRLSGSDLEARRSVRWERMVDGETGKKGWEWMKRGCSPWLSLVLVLGSERGKYEDGQWSDLQPQPHQAPSPKLQLLAGCGPRTRKLRPHACPRHSLPSTARGLACHGWQKKDEKGLEHRLGAW